MSSPSLPPELTDTIIDFVSDSDDDEVRFRTLSSLAFVSHPFRRRVNHTRFERVVIGDIDNIDLTYDLLVADRVWKYKHERVNAHVRAFEVQLVDNRDDLSPLSFLHTDTAKLEFILENVFQMYPHDLAPNIPLSFHWSIEIWRPLPPSDYTLHKLGWIEMSWGLQTALWTIIHNPRLRELELGSLKIVPRDLLRACPATALYFTEVTFADASLAAQWEGILSPWNLQRLTAFSSDHSTTLREFVGADTYDAEPVPTALFPQLQRLVCSIDNEGDYEQTVAFMQRARNIKRLRLSISEPHNLAGSLPYNHFTALDSMHMAFEGALRPLASNYQEQVRGIITPFLPSPPPVRVLEIGMAIISTNYYQMDLKVIFRGHDFSPIDEFFAGFSQSLPQIIELHLRVAVTGFKGHPEWKAFSERFEQEGGEYVQKVLFPKLAAKQLPALRVVIDADIYDDMKVEHYHSEDPSYEWVYAVGIYPDMPLDADDSDDSE